MKESLDRKAHQLQEPAQDVAVAEMDGSENSQDTHQTHRLTSEIVEVRRQHEPRCDPDAHSGKAESIPAGAFRIERPAFGKSARVHTRPEVAVEKQADRRITLEALPRNLQEGPALDEIQEP